MVKSLDIVKAGVDRFCGMTIPLVTREMLIAGAAYVEAWDNAEPLAENILTYHELAKQTYLAMRRLEP